MKETVTTQSDAQVGHFDFNDEFPIPFVRYDKDINFDQLYDYVS